MENQTLELTEAASTESRTKPWLLITSVVLGAAYGLLVRMLAAFRWEILQVMSCGFLFFMPFALGCIAVYIVEIKQPQKTTTWLWLPLLPMLAALGGTIITLLEGWICVVMFLPIAIPLAVVGGTVGGAAARYVRSRRRQSLAMICIVMLPFLTGPWEKHAFYEWETRQVENIVDIQAPADVVWRNIERVPAIRTEELPRSWAHSIGFPDPIEATLSHEGVGGVRNATFAKDLSFLETVDVWEPNQRLGFTIAANNVPPTTLDEHVKIGGQYFDVLRGEYPPGALAQWRDAPSSFQPPSSLDRL